MTGFDYCSGAFRSSRSRLVASGTVKIPTKSAWTGENLAHRQAIDPYIVGKGLPTYQQERRPAKPCGYDDGGHGTAMQTSTTGVSAGYGCRGDGMEDADESGRNDRDADEA
jgi:hypothetical protein